MSDLDHIKQIEQALNVKLKQTKTIEEHTNDYTVNAQGAVTGIRLWDCAIGDLQRISVPLAALPKLTILDVSDNQIRDLTPLTKLTGLKELSLSNNQIRDLSPLENLKCLELLSLHNNRIEALPAWITDFNMDIQWRGFVDKGYITFYDNPLKTPPPEIVKQGKDAVRNYFQQLQAQTEDYLFEAKLLIVGEPGAGKTSLAWKMENANCDLPEAEETTKGIDVLRYEFPVETGRRPVSKLDHPTDWREDETGRRPVSTHQFRLNIWDFGGQEIYKATHRFFLSKRALYALVADSRNEDTDFNYWLHIVEMFGGDSLLLIVLNEKHQRRRNLDVTAMRARFSNIVDVLENEKLSKLFKNYVIETDPTRKFQTEHHIQEVYVDSEKFGGALDADNAKRMKAFMAVMQSGA